MHLIDLRYIEEPSAYQEPFLYNSNIYPILNSLVNQCKGDTSSANKSSLIKDIASL